MALGTSSTESRGAKESRALSQERRSRHSTSKPKRLLFLIQLLRGQEISILCFYKKILGMNVAQYV